MIGIVIVAHGRLAEEYRAAMEHVVGPLSNVHTVEIAADEDRNAKQAEICDAANAVDVGKGVVIVVDMFGGSPSNLAIKACNPQNRRILYGANLPMLIKLAKSRHRPVQEAVDAAIEAAHKYIDSMSVGAP